MHPVMNAVCCAQNAPYDQNSPHTNTLDLTLNPSVIGFTYAFISSESLSPLCLCLLPWSAQLGSALADLITGPGPSTVSFPRDSLYIGRRPATQPLGSQPGSLLRQAWALTAVSSGVHLHPLMGPDAGEPGLCTSANEEAHLVQCAGADWASGAQGERSRPGTVHSKWAKPSSCAPPRPLPLSRKPAAEKTLRCPGYIFSQDGDKGMVVNVYISRDGQNMGEISQEGCQCLCKKVGGSQLGGIPNPEECNIPVILL